MEWLDVASFSDHSKAEALKTWLDRKGFHTRIYDESTLQKLWFLSPPLGAFRVEISKKEEAEFLKCVNTWNTLDGPWNTAIQCPECYSRRVEFPQITRYFITVSILPILFAKLFHQQRFYCKTCHHTWLEKEESKLSKQRTDHEILEHHSLPQ